MYPNNYNSRLCDMCSRYYGSFKEISQVQIRVMRKTKRFGNLLSEISASCSLVSLGKSLKLSQL